jgi:hypothetical protein
MGLAQLREAKRKDFVRVEYIENTSTAYIDTNIQFNLSMEINGKFQNMDNTTSERDRRYFGGATTWKGYGLSVSENSIMLNEALSWDDGIKTYNVSTPFEIHYKNKSVTVNNYTVNLNTTKGNSTEVPTIYLLAEHRPNTAAISFLIGRLYYFKIYNENDVLVRDYIPMYQISTDTYGLWDRVEKKFYTSPNGVKFIGGREIIYDAEIEYLESTGTQYIQLDCNVTKTNKFTVGGVIIPIYTSNKGDYAVFGAKPWTQYIGAFYSKNNNNNITYSSIIGGLGSAGGVGGGWGGTVGTEVSFELSTTEKVINGVHTAISRPLTNNITEFRIFGGYRDNQRYPIKIKSLYIKKENEILYDFIPVRIGNVGYLYDKVSNKLFGNDGTGTFVLGQDTIVYDKI